MSNLENIKKYLINDKEEEAMSVVIANLKELIKRYSSKNIKINNDDLRRDREFISFILQFEVLIFFESEYPFESRNIFSSFEGVARELQWILNDLESSTPPSFSEKNRHNLRIEIFNGAMI